ncbi:MAG: Thioredoxin-like [2Fe-2S] ferredoxin [Holophagaceae bacterium]|nr:Thioredoxin-like [2Fe-2S] ferredoxin [Holophagaceae bacterium]
MIQIKVCCGLNCAAHGGQELLALLEESGDLTGRVEVAPVPCLHCCQEGEQSPVVQIGDEIHTRVSSEQLQETLEQLMKG